MKELGPDARTILDAGRSGDDPTPADRARLRAAVMRRVAASAALGAAATTAAQGTALGASTLIASGIKVVTVLIVASAACVGAVRLLAQASAPTRPATATAIASSTGAPLPISTPAARDARAAPASSSEVAPAPPVHDGRSADSAASAPMPSAPAARLPPQTFVDRGRSSPPTDPRPRARSGSAAPTEDALEVEARGLGEAHGALQEGDPARALRLLDQQSTAYAGGQLGEEREAARVLALCKLGRVDEASAARARFLDAHPRSPLADRVRNACAAAASAGIKR
jgi:hypothetical protein